MLCTQCGNPVDDNARFCGKCGAKIGEEPIGTPAQPQSNPLPDSPACQLTIKRNKVFMGGSHVKIMINEMDMGMLANGCENTYIINTDIVTVKIIPAKHSVELKLQLYSNARLEFSVIDKSRIIRHNYCSSEVLLERLSGAVILQ